jgi:hypothetical protein
MRELAVTCVLALSLDCGTKVIDDGDATAADESSSDEGESSGDGDTSGLPEECGWPQQ